MKTKLLICIWTILGLGFTACDDDNDNINIDPAIENSFRNQYPHTSRVEWEKKAGYFVADFWQNNTEAEAWYSPDAVWYMTETDLPYNQLPEAVRNAFQSSDYAQWRVDDIDMLEVLDIETVYILEVEQGEVEYDLYYSPEGILAKVVLDQGGKNGHHPPVVSQEVKSHVVENHPQAKIIDIETENNTIEVDILDGQVPRELRFTLSGQWMYTKTEIHRADIPAIVLNALNSSQYGTWHIDDIDFYQTPENDYYLFELESGNKEANLKIDTDGKIF